MLAFTLFVAIWPQGCPAEQFEVGLPAFLEDVLGVIFGVVDGEVFRLEGSDELVELLVCRSFWVALSLVLAFRCQHQPIVGLWWFDR